MPLPRQKPWATDLKCYWTMSIPSPVNGSVPGWSAMVGKIIDGYNVGKTITMMDGGQIYILVALTGTELRLIGRIYPTSTNASIYIRSINRATGAVTAHTLTLPANSYT